MREAIVLSAVVTVAVATVATSLGVVWLCVKVQRLLEVIGDSAKRNHEASDILQCTVLDALAGIQEDVIAAKMQAALTAQRVGVAAELGYQNAEAADRIEQAAAHVAEDLAESISRADATDNSTPGASADAALRSGVTAAEIREEQVNAAEEP